MKFAWKIAVTCQTITQILVKTVASLPSWELKIIGSPTKTFLHLINWIITKHSLGRIIFYHIFIIDNYKQTDYHKGGGGGWVGFTPYNGLYRKAPSKKGNFFRPQIYLTIIPWLRMGSESIAHEAEGRIDSIDSEAMRVRGIIVLVKFN